jgi:hypothetical protein
MRPVTVKAGQNVLVDAQYVAEPEPTGSWSLEGVELAPNDRFSFSLGGNSAKLNLLKAKRSDTGKYVLKLTNGSGTDQAGCDIIVLCKLAYFENAYYYVQLSKLFLIFKAEPSKPRGPIEIKDVKK